MTEAYEIKATAFQNIIRTKMLGSSANKTIEYIKKNNPALSLSRKVALRLIKETKCAIELEKEMYGRDEEIAERISKGAKIRAIKEAKRNKTPDEKQHLNRTKTIQELRDENAGLFDDDDEYEGGTRLWL